MQNTRPAVFPIFNILLLSTGRKKTLKLAAPNKNSSNLIIIFQTFNTLSSLLATHVQSSKTLLPLHTAPLMRHVITYFVLYVQSSRDPYSRAGHLSKNRQISLITNFTWMPVCTKRRQIFLSPNFCLKFLNYNS